MSEPTLQQMQAQREAALREKIVVEFSMADFMKQSPGGLAHDEMAALFQLCRQMLENNMRYGATCTAKLASAEFEKTKHIDPEAARSALFDS